jgi:acetyl-CoA synthetase
MGQQLAPASVPTRVTEPTAGPPPTGLGDYDEARRSFTWEWARSLLDGLPGGRGLNIAHEAVDRHATGTRADHVALRFLSDGEPVEWTYARLADETSRFANVLSALGVDKGDGVVTLLDRRPELYTACLGTLKRTAVYTPLFAAFGREPVRQRLQLGHTRVLVTTDSLYRKRIEAIRADLPELEHVLLVRTRAGELPSGTADLAALMAEASTEFEIPPTDPEDRALVHFTSGTTGVPKGAIHVHEAVVAHHVTGRFALDLRPDDVYWCTADPGWVTGTSYGIIAPLTAGLTVVVDRREFDAERWYATLDEQRITVWYTSPTAARMLMRAGDDLPRAHDLGSVRFAASVGEPLNPEVVEWSTAALGFPLHDNWWQTETGGIMIANYRTMDIKPGSMGRPLPGIEAAVLRRDAEGELLRDDEGMPERAAVGESGELALRPGWPSMFRGYLDAEDRYARCFRAGWYLSGDLATIDDDGYFWYVGRGDDVIKTAGHLIGPFEVESALMEHPDVVEVGVIGKPDEVAGNVVKAFVCLRPGVEPSDDLSLELLGFARGRLGATVAPREIEFVDQLPHTKSGKILRRLLRARELGLPEGDLSSLEERP